MGPGQVTKAVLAEIGPFDTVNYCGRRRRDQDLPAMPGRHDPSGAVGRRTDVVAAPQLVLQPGQAGDITVTITPTANSGAKVSGFLAVDTWNPNTISSDQLVNIPYRYRVG